MKFVLVVTTVKFCRNHARHIRQIAPTPFNTRDSCLYPKNFYILYSDKRAKGLFKVTFENRKAYKIASFSKIYPLCKRFREELKNLFIQGYSLEQF